MGNKETEFSPSEVAHQSVSAQIQLATEPILKQVKKLKNCVLLAEWNNLISASNTEVTGFRRDEMLSSSSDKWYYKVRLYMNFFH